MEKINRVLHNWTTGPTIPSFTIFQSLLKFIILTTIFFSVRVFFHRHWSFTGQQEKEEDHLLFHSTTSACSRTLSQNATRWVLPLYQITIWLIDWLIDDAMFVCLLDELILGVCYSHLTWETGGFELASTMSVVFTPATPIKQLIMIQYLLQW